VQIESRVMARMAINHIAPAALEYKTRLLQIANLTKETTGNMDGCRMELLTVDRINRDLDEINFRVNAMVEARKRANAITSEYEKAVAYHEVADMFPTLRKLIDDLEEIVDNMLWPLPKYREMLFIS
ncbi:MAG: glutamine synthetase type III, partial [Bacteroidales bacterium]|nr:glutamine synthetase type III [Bacteroidales bacterium]